VKIGGDQWFLDMDEILKQEGYELVGAAMEVYNVMGSGYLEDVYQECLERELTLRTIPFESQPQLDLYYKGEKLGRYYRPDFYVYDGIVVELKAVKKLGRDEMAQILNYLKGAEKRVGYLLNFGSSRELEWKRFVL
jgi:GxxExxY protein